MSKLYNSRAIERRAEQILRKTGATTLPINLRAIAEKNDITVESKPNVGKGVSGMLMRSGNNFGILYAAHIKNTGFKRFSIAHELGHYFLEGHVDAILKNGEHKSHAGFISNNQFEIEADQFAASLLMPEFLCQQIISKLPPGLETIKIMSEQCQTSLIASAIRYSRLTEYAVAVIVSTDGVVDYCFMSGPMKSIKDITWLNKGENIPHSKATSHLFSSDVNNGVEDETDILDWFGGNKSLLLKEEAIRLGNYKKVLTILSRGDIDLDDDEEQNLQDDWLPKF